jgi:hypothetical protein
MISFSLHSQTIGLRTIEEKSVEFRQQSGFQESGWLWRTAYGVLNGLTDEEEIHKKKPEARSVIWIRP